MLTCEREQSCASLNFHGQPTIIVASSSDNCEDQAFQVLVNFKQPSNTIPYVVGGTVVEIVCAV